MHRLSLAQVVDAEAWQGYPARPEDGHRPWEASAVAWLDSGLWLHHTLRVTEDDGATDVLTLIAPCTCGRGYVDITLDSEDVLMEILPELRPTQGLVPHSDALGRLCQRHRGPAPQRHRLLAVAQRPGTAYGFD